jgi:hypothetical protein
MRLSSRSFIVLTFLALAACHNRPPVVTTQQPVVAAPPPAPALPTLEPAIRDLVAGAYETAKVDFNAYLKRVPTGGQRDDAFFYLGMLSLVSESPQDWESATTYFDQLLTEFPQTHHKLVVQFLFSLRKETTELSSNIERANQEAARLQKEADDLRNSLTVSTEKVATLTKTADQLTQEAERDRQRIKELNTQLDRLIKIDSGPRPR